MIIPWVVWDLRSLERQTSRWQLLTPHLGNHQPSLKHTRNHNNLKKIVLNFGLPERKIMDLDRRSLRIRQSVRMPNVTTICTWKFGGCRNFRNCEHPLEEFIHRETFGTYPKFTEAGRGLCRLLRSSPTIGDSILHAMIMLKFYHTRRNFINCVMPHPSFGWTFVRRWYRVKFCVAKLAL